MRRATTRFARLALALALGCGIVAPVAAAKPAAVPATAPTPVAPATRSQTRTFTLSFKQLGIDTPLTLRGVEGIAGIPFNIRADEVVVAARLRLAYAYSPALRPDTSHLALLVNGEVASTLALPKVQGAPQQRTVTLDPRMITEFNRLNIKLIGHYTEQCEDPMHSSLWAVISNQSALDITVAPLALAPDLGLLPAPLFDRRDARRLELPFVFGARPALSTLEAAGTLAAWFGALAGYRGALFPARLDQLPESGNAVLFATPAEAPAGITLPAIEGPTLAIVGQPNDPNGKLLLVLGRDGNELKQAARALALGARALSGTTALVRELAPAPARAPHDAPNWVATDRPVRLGDLAASADLTVRGYDPELVRINLRLPPDLFIWRSGGVPLDLKYRYTPRPVPDKSTLNIGINQGFIASIKLPAVERAGVPAWLERFWPAVPSRDSRRVNIPAYALSPNSQLQFHYQYEYLKQGACRDTIIQNVSGTIDGDSSLDLSALPHFIALPDLAVFANSGFPFTRMADLSQTAVLLPAAPRAVHLSAYLALMGRMGESTGYPATGVSVALASQAAALADKDLLVIGSERDQPLFAAWRRALPFFTDGKDQHFALASLSAGAGAWWRTFGERPAPGRLGLRQDAPGPLLMGFESPLRAGRSVVALHVDQDDDYASLLEALLRPEQISKIHGAAVALRGGQVLTLDDATSYHVGWLPPALWAHWWLSSRPWLLALAAAACAGLLGLLAFLSLRRRAAVRLGRV